MKQDLIARLRDSHRWCIETGKGGRTSTDILREAADALEPLAGIPDPAGALQAARRALEMGVNAGSEPLSALRDACRAALARLNGTEET